MTNREAIQLLKEIPVPRMKNNSEEETQLWFKKQNAVAMAIKELEKAERARHMVMDVSDPKEQIYSLISSIEVDYPPGYWDKDRIVQQLQEIVDNWPEESEVPE